MKLLMTLLVAGVLAAYYFGGTGYLKQRQQQENLNSQIADASRALAQTPQPPKDLEEQLAVAQANLTAAESEFPGQVNSTQVINAVLKLAGDVGVKAIPLITKPWTAEKNGEHDYYVLRLNISVSGSFPQLAEFTDRLENSEFPTLIISYALALEAQKRFSEVRITEIGDLVPVAQETGVVTSGEDSYAITFSIAVSKQFPIHRRVSIGYANLSLWRRFQML